jgi:hypothetical protein
MAQHPKQGMPKLGTNALAVQPTGCAGNGPKPPATSANSHPDVQMTKRLDSFLAIGSTTPMYCAAAITMTTITTTNVVRFVVRN